MRLILFSGALLIALWWGYEQAIDNCYSSYFYLDTWPKVSQKPLRLDEKRVLQTILQQPFTYLGKGRQFFVFESADGKWVLKFIKCQRINPRFLLDTFRPKRIEEKQKRVERIFTSLQLAHEKLADLTAVLYVNLSRTPKLETKVHLINKLGQSFEQDIDLVPCVIQKKAAYVFPVLEKLALEKNEHALQERMNQLTILITELANRDVTDIDDGAVLRDNIGFLEDRAIFVDVGTFIENKEAKMRLQQDLQRLDPVKKKVSGLTS